MEKNVAKNVRFFFDHWQQNWPGCASVGGGSALRLHCGREIWRRCCSSRWWASRKRSWRRRKRHVQSTSTQRSSTAGCARHAGLQSVLPRAPSCEFGSRRQMSDVPRGTNDVPGCQYLRPRAEKGSTEHGRSVKARLEIRRWLRHHWWREAGLRRGGAVVPKGRGARVRNSAVQPQCVPS